MKKEELMKANNVDSRIINCSCYTHHGYHRVALLAERCRSWEKEQSVYAPFSTSGYVPTRLCSSMKKFSKSESNGLCGFGHPSWQRGAFETVRETKR